jgi:hypothetical protein
MSTSLKGQQLKCKAATLAALYISAKSEALLHFEQVAYNYKPSKMLSDVPPLCCASAIRVLGQQCGEVMCC